MAPIPETFKAYRYERWGRIEDVLQIGDVKKAPLPAMHVRVQVHSAALNPVDFKIAQTDKLVLTRVPPSAENPYPVGFDVSGVVVEVGSGLADKFTVGDEVFAMTPISEFGSLTQYLSVDTHVVTHKPKSLDFDHAAAVPLVSITSYQALTMHGKTKVGERVLILGGSTATGIFAVQYAKALGAHVVATASAKNVDFVKSLGADQVIDYTSQKWDELLEAHSIDVIYDTVGEQDAWNHGGQSVLKKETGRFVTIVSHHETKLGMAETPTAVNPAKFGASYTEMIADTNAVDLAAIAKLIEDGKIKVFVDSVFPFEKATEAFTRLKTSRAVGKVVVKVQ